MQRDFFNLVQVRKQKQPYTLVEIFFANEDTEGVIQKVRNG